jgi:hypothetical protein
LESLDYTIALSLLTHGISMFFGLVTMAGAAACTSISVSRKLFLLGMGL